MKIVIFGLTITSSWGNGHATTFRSLVKALAQRGHQVVFVEKDVEWYRNNRDLPQPAFCTLRLYDEWLTSEGSFVAECVGADAVIIGSYFPDAIAATSALLQAGVRPLIFYDIDTPITIAALRTHGSIEYLDAAMVRNYDAYLSFTGGPILAELVTRFGARLALPFYCSVDPDVYRPVPLREDLQCDLSYLGTYASDRQPNLMRLLNQSAVRLPNQQFIVAGAMYPTDTAWAPNVQQVTHVPPPQHPAFYSSARFTLNLTRADMVAAGYSPSVRLFEASSCGATILSDDWKGLDELLTPGEEVLLPRNEQEVADILLHLSETERLRIGMNARERILSENTSSHRAAQFDDIVSRLGNHSNKQNQVPQAIPDKVQAVSLEAVSASTPL